MVFNSLLKIRKGHMIKQTKITWVQLSILFLRFRTSNRGNINVKKIFQFSFWDSNAVFNIVYAEGNFQFSFWDSWFGWRTFRKAWKNSFNSLFEILNNGRGLKMVLSFGIFQFSFWDSTKKLLCVNDAKNENLSILFLRFWNWN